MSGNRQEYIANKQKLKALPRLVGGAVVFLLVAIIVKLAINGVYPWSLVHPPSQDVLASSTSPDGRYVCRVERRQGWWGNGDYYCSICDEAGKRLEGEDMKLWVLLPNGERVSGEALKKAVFHWDGAGVMVSQDAPGSPNIGVSTIRGQSQRWQRDLIGTDTVLARSWSPDQDYLCVVQMRGGKDAPGLVTARLYDESGNALEGHFWLPISFDLKEVGYHRKDLKDVSVHWSGKTVVVSMTTGKARYVGTGAANGASQQWESTSEALSSGTKPASVAATQKTALTGAR